MNKMDSNKNMTCAKVRKSAEMKDVETYINTIHSINTKMQQEDDDMSGHRLNRPTDTRFHH